MGFDIKNKIDKVAEEISEKTEQVKRSASAGLNRASAVAKDFAGTASTAAKDAATKAAEGVNSGVEVVGERIQYKKSVLKAANEIDDVIKELDAAINPNMDEYLSQQLELLSEGLKDLYKTIRKDTSNAMGCIEMAKAKVKAEKNNLTNVAVNDFTRLQLIKHYTKAINACEVAGEILRDTGEDLILTPSTEEEPSEGAELILEAQITDKAEEITFDGEAEAESRIEEAMKAYDAAMDEAAGVN